MPGPSQQELQRLSARPYSARVGDPEDFASVYEKTLVPLIIDLLQANCDCDFSVDVHNFPELSSETVPRVIYITLPMAATGHLQELMRGELARHLPAKFHQTHLKFRKGSVKRTTWWGTDDEKHLDHVCRPKNVMFHSTPHMGMSIGPHCSHEDAGSAGGFLKIGTNLYGVSCRHVVEQALRNDDGDTRVVHPAHGDHRLNQAAHPRSQQSTMGSVFLCSRKDPITKRDVTRVSSTFAGSGVSERRDRVAMDWCLFGPVPQGKNYLHVPSIGMDRLVAVEKSAMIEANTEVYALARTSGYSLGFTCDVPGVQRLEGSYRREWTVRQYSPSNWDRSTYLEPPWQSVRKWVTSGIGVPGDSGAWLMRRSDNAVIGLIWARNHNHGSPFEVERIRLTYITPIVDVLADIRERVAEQVTLPAYSEEDLRYDAHTAEGPWALATRQSIEPWNPLSPRLLGRCNEEDSGTGPTVLGSNGRSSPPQTHSSPASTASQHRGSQGDDAISLASYSSTSVQPSPHMSDYEGSSGRSTASAALRLGEGLLFAIGMAEVLHLRRPELTPPDLEPDLSGNSSASGESLEEVESSLAGPSIVIAGQDSLDDDQEFVEGAEPIRAKATFPSAGATPVFMKSQSTSG
jgi:hypothetical protein